MIRRLARRLRSLLHASEAVFVHLSPSGLLVIPADLVLRARPRLHQVTCRGDRYTVWNGWVYIPDRDTLDSIVAELEQRERPQ